MARRIIGLWLPWLVLEAHLRRQPALAGRALVACRPGRRGPELSVVSPPAAAAGLQPGQTLADARAVLPAVVPLFEDPAAQDALLQRLVGWCRRWTPSVAADGPDGLVLDVSGCAHLVGGEAALLALVVGRLGELGFTARAALADTAAAAWALAHYGSAAGPLLVPPGEQRVWLAPLPVAALRLESALVRGLIRLGLRRIGDLYSLPRPALARRFGPLVAERLDRALGRVDQPLSPEPLPTILALRQGFAEPMTSAEAIDATVRQLMSELCRQLEQAGLGARRLELIGWRAERRLGQGPQVISVGTVTPGRDPARWLRLLGLTLERIEPGLGLDALELVVRESAPLAAQQIGFGQPLDAAPGEGGAGGGAGGAAAALDELADRLAARLGPAAVGRLVPRASWWPERATVFQPLDAEPLPPAPPWPADRPRPLRLLAVPEPVEVVAPVPDDPPLLFRWRRQLHRVGWADGPERLSAEWWHAGGASGWRDYYRVEDRDGRRFWLYREGPAGDRPGGRWFLQGWFG